MTILDLWLPILLAAVLVFVVSSVIHVALPIHKSDYKGLPGEAALLGAMRENGVTPGHYVFPYAASMSETGTPEMQAKLAAGPIGFMTVMPKGGFAMGRSLLQWFVLSIVIGVFVAWIGTFSLAAGAPGGEVFRVTAVAGVFGYALSHVQDSIWKGLSWWISAKFVFDGTLYGLATAAAFAWTWPAA